jgi:hypothetical protein
MVNTWRHNHKKSRLASSSEVHTRGGPWYPEKWGGSTYRGNTAFLHITGEIGKELFLPPVQNKIVNARTLTGGDVSFSQTDIAVIIDLKEVKKNIVFVVHLNF